MPAGGATRTASTLAAYIGTPGGTTQANALSDRCALIGGSDARIILGDDEAAPLLLWTEKRDRVPAGR
jgi:hypothetical protein